MAGIQEILSDEAKQAAAAVGVANESDVILFNSRIQRKHQEKFLSLVDSRTRLRPNVLLILLTEGGDPHAAYKISRLLQQWYTKFICFLPAYSKSAATVVLMGAHELVILDDGEMGPVDVQLSKKDALLEYESGLTVLSAMTALHEKAYLAWEHFFLEMEDRGQGSITLKTAAHVAAELATGLFAPVYQQIDPLQLGEAVRAMSIGNEYGKRLNKVSKNLRPRALERLVSEYPDHGFVIDRAEAESLFYHVRDATADEATLCRHIEAYCDIELGRKSPIIDFLNEEEAVPAPQGGAAGGTANAGTDRNGDQARGEHGIAAPAALAGAGIQANGH
jgi:hypothetical protein